MCVASKGNKQTKILKLSDTENRSIFTRGRRVGGIGEIGEGGQKVKVRKKTFSEFDFTVTVKGETEQLSCSFHSFVS